MPRCGKEFAWEKSLKCRADHPDYQRGFQTWSGVEETDRYRR